MQANCQFDYRKPQLFDTSLFFAEFRKKLFLPLQLGCIGLSSKTVSLASQTKEFLEFPQVANKKDFHQLQTHNFFTSI